jgi:glucose/arabinose dehydrogenase
MSHPIRLAIALLAAGMLVAGSAAPARGLGEARAELVVSGLTYPIFVAAPEGDPRLFVVERAGIILIFENGSLLPDPFLDIQGLVTTLGEGGLLGLAFAPDYAESGLFYVYYTNLADDTVIARYAVSADPDVADPGSGTPILIIDQPDMFANHKGGTIAFGPDGFLWLATGDGGGGYDPNGNGQNPLTLLGKMLRLDVGADDFPADPLRNYAIPADNPFVSDPGTRDEIWALGLRNPFRWSFDRETGDLWIGDVGQTLREEVDFEPAGDPGGRNYGWDVMEGTLCNTTNPSPSPPCNDPSLTLPVHEYDHSDGRCSITGGNVHRAGITPLTGLYFFADFCSKQVWSLDTDTFAVVDRTVELFPLSGSTNRIVGFGEDGFGRLYAASNAGRVFRIVPEDPACADGIDNDGDGHGDFPADPGCPDAAGALEDPECDDGLDNDGDGRIDWDGAGVGVADPQCLGEGWRDRERRKLCGLGFELVLALPALLALRGRMRTAR